MISISRPYFSAVEADATAGVLASGNVTQGVLTQEFESKIARYVDRTYAVALSSGTAAIHTALHAIGTSPNDEIITTAFTFVGTVNPILAMGARPVFVDISQDDYCIDIQAVERAITPRTKAILPVDIFGQIYNSEPLRRLARDAGITLIEDACQSFGASRNNIKAGSHGDIGVYSFHATKIITTIEGGMLVTNNKIFAERAMHYRSHNQKQHSNYDYIGPGYNYRFTDLEAAIGIAQLSKIEEIIDLRRRNADIYNSIFRSNSYIVTPKISPKNDHVYAQYCILLPDERTRNYVYHELLGCGIQTRIYYPKALVEYDFLSSYGSVTSIPNIMNVKNRILALPVHPSLSVSDIEMIAHHILRLLKT